MSDSTLSSASNGHALTQPRVYVVDDDLPSRQLIVAFLKDTGYEVQVYSSAVEFLQQFQDDPARPCCLVSDVCMPVVDGLDLQRQLANHHVDLPIVFVSAVAGVPAAVEAIKCGALDFLTKPLDRQQFVECVHQAIAKCESTIAGRERNQSLHSRIARLTPREREVMQLLVHAKTTKEIAASLNINAKTVFVHRARIMEKMKVDSLVELSLLVTGAANSLNGA